MIRELHRPIPLDRIGRDGMDVLVEATPAECAALADRMQLPAVQSLTCAFHLQREDDDRVLARGHLRASVVQTCIVSLEDFETSVDETFRVRFVPSGEEEEEITDPESVDEIPYEGRALDLGEAAAEQLGLALDPYPRMPDAELPDIEVEADENPFARLAALRRPN
ncbi:MAG: DUF177 domain-containing protein [Acetobacteraceae bacterium]